ncbi:MAG: aminomethyl-transferring glycine dehydrogenase subunit GcvPB [Candidatus Cloacimonetes bacterium]|nr:aminomethyl-transferring glycine dehydrogenase subunit GcvPB [Candidatus Cloacimonadota bacterium]MCF7813116.1 aminomethyl-transferring glycine dehydrogenase subunit GcvPB [Candidatus Cloacimonadota bacterium]MCF7867564.1 aminomethyl-transferring glycine dehydrogenase subunit GcvPB [Candidatus Cloacimonadota bacterium]MCF7883042.1 aminomethyl-transferring glycine dehydrogenase subunit GcvPB [Candidatus Cloacimonadota bacterium]
MAKTIFERTSPGRKGYTLPANDVNIKPESCIPEKYQRKSEVKLPEVSELDVMRHFLELAHMNHCIEKGFYPLGSCTMKYNPKINETLARNTGLNNLHPLQDEDTVQGALEILFDLQEMLAEISGFNQVTLQPVAGAHGEFTGLKVMKAYHESKGNSHKNKIILPDSAHGTNPASVTLTGYEVVEIKSNADGMVDIEDLIAHVDENTAGFMLTNPNTLGLFEKQVEEIAEIIHAVDGLIYMDGANFNAILGIVKPGQIGFDIMHYNLHKTFATPHGGGGPGSGPIGVREDLAKFLPAPLIGRIDDKYFLDFGHEESTFGKVHSFFGNFLVNVRAYIYIKMVGNKGLRDIAENAVINANYLMKNLENFYNIPHKDIYCMHEFVASGEWQKQKYGIKTLDIAKRILDKGFHAPTIYFPLIVHEAMMIEPTETESKETLDEFVAAMIEIAKECEENPELLTNAPQNTPVKRVDDTLAVRQLNVKFEW